MRTRKTRKARTASDSTAVHEGGAAFPHLIVAIGASAGGLDALRRFFAGVPADTGFAFVVLFHADPGQPSLLADLLAAGAHVPVVRIAPGMALQADRIHVMAPGTLPELRQGRLVLASPGQGRDVRHPIDAFFVSLARDQGERAVGIILSGALDDGSLGVCAIKDAGGHTLVERPDTAQFDGMPSHAVATGCVDDCAPVEELAAVLLQYVRSSTWPEPAGDQTVDPSIAARLPAICAVLQRSTGNDFGGYKRTTLIRRIQHRMQMLRISDVDVYVRALSDDPHEPELLLKEMLIGVTQFFRDPEAFDAIDRLVLTPLFAEPFADRTVRVWVAGCATGEEAYSLAILLYEHMERCTVPPRRVTVFATDIDRAALNVARRGRYPLSIANDITPARLERFFVRDGDAYEAHKSVRDLCTFSRHNVTQDPPFARLNLLCCRNLLIYFDVQMQRQLMPLFHYALLPGGCLMLGPSEQASETQFTVLDKKTRLYRRRDLGSRQPVVFPLPRLTPATAPARMQEPVAAGEQTVVRTLERILLNQYTPASVVLTDLGEIVYTAGPIDRFLALAPGLPTMDFYQLARVDVRPELRSLVRRISTSPGGIATTEMPPAAGECLRIEARRLTELTSADLTLVVFRPSPLAAPEIASQAVEGPDDPMQLRLQLESTRQHLHAAVEEVEHANQDLRVSNEELLSLNEELQSANEELQTAKEEMQSVNEELETVNSELHAKLEELGVTHADLQNLFRAAEIATLFLDRGLTIQRFTPASRALFRLIDSDVGRPILDIVARFGVVDLAGAIETVLATLAVLEREVVTDDGKRTFLMRILPYHTIMGLVDGVVLTFVDVTELKWAQAAAAQLAAIVRSSLDAIFSVSADGLVTSWNAGAEAVYGYAPAEIVGRSAAVLDVAMLTEALHQPLHALGATGAIPRSARQRRKDGQEIDVLVTLSPLTDAQGRSVGVSVIARDVTAELEAEAARQAVRTAHQLQEAATLAQLRHEVAERAGAEEALRQSEEQYRALFEVAPIGTAQLEPGTGRFLRVNGRLCAMLGRTQAVLAESSVLDLVQGADREALARAVEQVSLGSLQEFASELQFVRALGEGFWGATSLASVVGLDGKVVALIWAVADVTAHRELEERLQQSRKMEALGLLAGGLAHDFNNMLTGILGFAELSIETTSDPEVRENLREIVATARRAADLAGRLLGFARKQVVTPRVVELHAVIAGAEHMLRSLVGPFIHLQAAAPPEAAYVRIDPSQFEQVVVNLVVNARDAMPKGGRLRIVQTLVEAPQPGLPADLAPGRYVKLKFHDTGTGMTPEQLSHCFEPFYTTKPRGSGTGLGLSSAFGVVTQAGGRLDAKSRPGKGTVVRILLPAVAAPESQVPAPAPIVADAHGTETVLLVDDTPEVLKLASHSLKLFGYNVVTASDGVDALAVAEAHPDLKILVTDVLMPKMGGMELARRLTARLPGLRVLFISGYTEDALTGADIEQPGRAFLGKPFSPRELAEGVRGLLDHG